MKLFSDFLAKVDRRCEVEAEMSSRSEVRAKTAKKVYPARKILNIDFGVGFSRMARRNFRLQRRFRLYLFAIVNLSSDFAWDSLQKIKYWLFDETFFGFFTGSRPPMQSRGGDVESKRSSCKNREKGLPGAKNIKHRFWGWVFAYGSSQFSIGAAISTVPLRNFEFE